MGPRCSERVGASDTTTESSTKPAQTSPVDAQDRPNGCRSHPWPVAAASTRGTTPREAARPRIAPRPERIPFSRPATSRVRAGLRPSIRRDARRRSRVLAESRPMLIKSTVIGRHKNTTTLIASSRSSLVIAWCGSRTAAGMARVSRNSVVPIALPATTAMVLNRPPARASRQVRSRVLMGDHC